MEAKIKIRKQNKLSLLLLFAILFANSLIQAQTNTTYGGLMQDGNGVGSANNVATGNPGFGNTGFGTQALGPMGSATSGNLNTAVGYQALFSNHGASDNVAVGAAAMLDCQGCQANTASGQNALQGSLFGISNCAYGDDALFINQNNYNVAIGNVSLGQNGGGTQNTAVGWHAILSFPGSSASYNTGIGDEALLNNGGGEYNSALGMQAMQNNDNGNYNTASGYQAMWGIPLRIIGTGNTAAGTQSLFNLYGGSYNTVDGYQAMYGTPGESINASYNVAQGYQTLYRNILGNYNTASGYQAMFGVGGLGIGGTYNIATGYKTMFSIEDGSYNIASGYEAMQGNGINPIGADYNVVSGYQALQNVTAGSDNIAIGYQAMQGLPAPLIIGGKNAAVGYQSIHNITDGYFNTAEGYQSSFSNTSAWYNVAIGYQALMDNQVTFDLTAVGSGALQANTTGSLNAAFGFSALNHNVSGKSNTASGYYALFENVAGSSNTAMGYRALFFNNSDWNTAYGDSALHNNTTGKDNTSTGGKSMANTITGMSNTANGYEALFLNTAGSSNTAMGFKALYSDASDWNTALGDSALYSNGSGTNNTSTGGKSTRNNITGMNNTADGFESLYNNQRASSNTASGYQALYTNQADWNTGVGDSVLFLNNTGKNNTSTGGKSLISNVTGSSNTANGYEALFKNTASFNSALGDTALYNNISGTNNTATGYAALLNNTKGSYNSALGYNAGPTVPNGNLKYATAIGANSEVVSNNTIILGTNVNSPAPPTYVGIGMSGIAAGPRSPLEISYYGLLNPDPCNTTIPASTFTLTPCNSIPTVTGASGLQFRDLTDKSVPYPYVNGHGFLSLDDSGHVVYMASGGGSGAPGPCNLPTQILGGSAAYDLQSKPANFYFQGNGIGAGFTNVYIGTPVNSCVTPNAKLAVLQSSGSPSTIGIDVLNTDPGTCAKPVIGIASTVSYFSPNNHGIKIAGYFAAPPSASCCSTALLQYALFVPPNSGIVSIGYPLNPCLSSGPFASLQVNGSTWSTTGWNSSDSTLKTNVTPITNALSIIKAINGYSFNYIPSAITDTFISGTHYGFIAQKLARVLPNVVKTGASGIEAVGYTEIIPWLVEGMKQQQQMINADSIRISHDSLRIDSLVNRFDSLYSYINSIKNCLSQLCGGTIDTTIHTVGGALRSKENQGGEPASVQEVTLSSANSPLLYQNIPNPFSTGTKINYYLPQGTMGAYVAFFDSYGNQIKEVQLSQTGNGTLSITPDNLTNGIYSYSLVVNGNVIDTKRMVLQK